MIQAVSVDASNNLENKRNRLKQILPGISALGLIIS